MSGPRYSVKFRRRREGKTDYRHRLRLLRSNSYRLIVRNTNRNTIIQFARFEPDGDRILASAVSSQLKKIGWKYSTSTTPAAYLTGLLSSIHAKKIGIENAVLDMGMCKPVKGSKVFASVLGVMEGGININCDRKILPDEGRVMGKHINKDIASNVEEIKNKIGELK